MKLSIDIPGATAEEIERGIAAAQAVFNTAGVTAYDAARAVFQRDGHDMNDEIEFTEEQAAISHLWEEADFAVVEACCAEWPAEKVPGSAWLKLHPESA